MNDKTSGLTYSSSGVDIDAGNRLVDLIKPMVRSTFNRNVLADIGGFGGLYDVSFLKEFDNPVLVSSVDGVGTTVRWTLPADLDARPVRSGPSRPVGTEALPPRDAVPSPATQATDHRPGSRPRSSCTSRTGTP